VKRKGKRRGGKEEGPGQSLATYSASHLSRITRRHLRGRKKEEGEEKREEASTFEHTYSANGGQPIAMVRGENEGRRREREEKRRKKSAATSLRPILESPCPAIG